MYNKIYIALTILLRLRADYEIGSSNSSSSSSSPLSISSIIWNSFSCNCILYSSMPLMLMRASSLPSKLLDKLCFLKECLIRSFCFFTRSHASPTHFVVKIRLPPAVSFSLMQTVDRLNFVQKAHVHNSWMAC